VLAPHRQDCMQDQHKNCVHYEIQCVVVGGKKGQAKENIISVYGDQTCQYFSTKESLLLPEKLQVVKNFNGVL